MKLMYYSALARAGFILSSCAPAPLRRFLRRRHLLHTIVRLARRCAAKVFLPEEPVWVQVEGGLAEGVWLHLNLRDEAVYWLGSYDVRVQLILKGLCRPGCVFYDIGANLGFFSFAVAKSTRPNGKIIAFEPEPDNCARFREIVIRNNLQACIELVEAAVWSYSSSTGVVFQRGIYPRAHGGVLADGVSPVLAKGDTLVVPAVGLDDFLRTGQPAPDVLKVDVEGGECEVLKGAAELFSQAKTTLICEVHREQAAQWIAGWLVQKRYVMEWHVPDELYPRLLLAQPGGAARSRRYFAHE